MIVLTPVAKVAVAQIVGMTEDLIADLIADRIAAPTVGTMAVVHVEILIIALQEMTKAEMTKLEMTIAQRRQLGQVKRDQPAVDIAVVADMPEIDRHHVMVVAQVTVARASKDRKVKVAVVVSKGVDRKMIRARDNRIRIDRGNPEAKVHQLKAAPLLSTRCAVF